MTTMTRMEELAWDIVRLTSSFELSLNELWSYTSYGRASLVSALRFVRTNPQVFKGIVCEDDGLYFFSNDSKVIQQYTKKDVEGHFKSRGDRLVIQAAYAMSIATFGSQEWKEAQKLYNQILLETAKV